ncbi:hypothetical protein TomTYG75_09960 [Sphingobium sp. TomTYG75]
MDLDMQLPENKVSWHVEDGRLTRGIGEPAGFFICEPGNYGKAVAWMEEEEPARIAAAAPELLTALAEMVARFGHVKCLQVGAAIGALRKAGVLK